MVRIVRSTNPIDIHAVRYGYIELKVIVVWLLLIAEEQQVGMYLESLSSMLATRWTGKAETQHLPLFHDIRIHVQSLTKSASSPHSLEDSEPHLSDRGL
jgi:hypothetical protein